MDQIKLKFLYKNYIFIKFLNLKFNKNKKLYDKITYFYYFNYFNYFHDLTILYPFFLQIKFFKLKKLIFIISK